MKRLNEDLTRRNRELDSFTYVASHDLKEPLRGIHNYSHFLLEDYRDKLDEQGREQLLTLQRLTTKMEVLIEALLRYSRLGRQDIERRQIGLQSVLDEVCELLGPRLSESNVTVRVPQRLPMVAADPTLISELLTNLVANAVKYNNKDEKWIEVGYEAGDGVTHFMNNGDPEEAGDGRQPPLIVYVRDNGIGIPQKHHDTVFRIFKRLHGRDEFGGGTGAGLTIARKIVERHGGRIWLDSIPGEGTTVYFTLQGDSIDDKQQPELTTTDG